MYNKTMLAFLLIMTGTYFKASCEEVTVESEVSQSISVELQNLRRDLEDLKRDLEEIKTELNDINLRLTEYSYTKEHKANLAALSKLDPPEIERPSQVRAYVEMVYELSSEQTSWSTRDPQITMLIALTDKNLEIILDTVPTKDIGFNQCYVYAVADRLASENVKNVLIKALPERKFLVSIFERKGWLSDIQEILIRELSGSECVPSDWICACARLGRKELIPHLLRQMELQSGIGLLNSYWCLRDLPDGLLTPVIAQLWDRARTRPHDEILTVAPIAARSGNRRALEVLVESDGAYVYGPIWGMSGAQVDDILEMLVVPGSSVTDIRQWVRSNIAELEYDSKNQVFRLGANNSRILPPSG